MGFKKAISDKIDTQDSPSGNHHRTYHSKWDDILPMFIRKEYHMKTLKYVPYVLNISYLT